MIRMIEKDGRYTFLKDFRAYRMHRRFGGSFKLTNGTFTNSGQRHAVLTLLKIKQKKPDPDWKIFGTHQ